MVQCAKLGWKINNMMGRVARKNIQGLDNHSRINIFPSKMGNWRLERGFLDRCPLSSCWTMKLAAAASVTKRQQHPGSFPKATSHCQSEGIIGGNFKNNFWFQLSLSLRGMTQANFTHSMFSFETSHPICSRFS